MLARHLTPRCFAKSLPRDFISERIAYVALHRISMEVHRSALGFVVGPTATNMDLKQGTGTSYRPLLQDPC